MTTFLTQFDSESFISLLRKLIGESQYLQNNPPTLIPKERLVLNHVKQALTPYLDVLEYSEFEYTKDRPNVMITYRGTTNFSDCSEETRKTITFAGSHMDVVPADPTDKKWKYNPFELTVDGDFLYGRGTTDCLGHVALLTNLLIDLAVKKPVLTHSICVIFIADEEDGSDESTGIKHMYDDGVMDWLKNGPLYWVDVAESIPFVGSGTCMKWKAIVIGKGGHSAILENFINPVDIGPKFIEAVKQEFNKEFCKHLVEDEYGYTASSNLKATKIKVLENNSVNQIPQAIEFEGDVRLVPIYDPYHVQSHITKFVKNFDFSSIDTGHKNLLTKLEDGTTVTATFEWSPRIYKGIMCNLKTNGFKYLQSAVKTVTNNANTYANLGGLPLVLDLAEAGFDVQMIGFGKEIAYHAANEHCLLSDMRNGYNIFVELINTMT